jgi:hypothetical protein
VRLERGAAGVFGGVRVRGLDSGVIAGLQAAALVPGELARDDLTIDAVATR